MAKLLKLPSKAQARPLRWDVYRAAAKARLIGTVEAPDADTAIKVATDEYNVRDPRRLIAVRRG
jgi:1,2-phenylacetyl-CoA epoxidase PaaB subunit